MCLEPIPLISSLPRKNRLLIRSRVLPDRCPSSQGRIPPRRKKPTKRKRPPPGPARNSLRPTVPNVRPPVRAIEPFALHSPKWPQARTVARACSTRRARQYLAGCSCWYHRFTRSAPGVSAPPPVMGVAFVVIRAILDLQIRRTLSNLPIYPFVADCPNIPVPRRGGRTDSRPFQ